MLKRVKIQGYKSLVDVEVNLQPLCVLFGPNAAGKSNFLDALQLLSKIVSAKTLKDAFDYPYRGTPLESFTFGVEGKQGLLQRERVSFCIEVDVELSPSIIEAVNSDVKQMEGAYVPGDIQIKEEYLRYSLEVALSPKLGLLRIANEHVTVLDRDSNVEKPNVLLAWNESEQILHVEGRRAYHVDYLDQSALTKSLYLNQSPHLVALQREIESWLFFALEPREHMRTPTPVKEVRHIGLMGEEIAAFFNTLRASNERQFDAVEKALHVMLPSITGIDVSVNSIGDVELLLLEGQIPIPIDLLSEGTIRILGLLALSGSKEEPSLLCLEEPEAGIHPERIDLVARLLETQAMSDTQVIVTTHSPILIDIIAARSLYICRKVNGRTMIDPYSAWQYPDNAQVLEDEEESDLPELTVSGRLLRGDFNA